MIFTAIKTDQININIVQIIFIVDKICIIDNHQR
ncbi:hypothetical protein D791_02013 [Nitrincola nitratireducens]|uniref:Uncharacterized protein n=1 Tax=Nitrincola nitratireducens TaxID=1229521 RepID=W9VK37_9GAMM|nr:hypothetical protein D791_02013 [Nitrincola nitratireducens]